MAEMIWIIFAVLGILYLLGGSMWGVAWLILAVLLFIGSKMGNKELIQKKADFNNGICPKCQTPYWIKSDEITDVVYKSWSMSSHKRDQIRENPTRVYECPNCKFTVELEKEDNIDTEEFVKQKLAERELRTNGVSGENYW